MKNKSSTIITSHHHYLKVASPGTRKERGWRNCSGAPVPCVRSHPLRNRTIIIIIISVRRHAPRSKDSMPRAHKYQHRRLPSTRSDAGQKSNLSSPSRGELQEDYGTLSNTSSTASGTSSSSAAGSAERLSDHNGKALGEHRYRRRIGLAGAVTLVLMVAAAKRTVFRRQRGGGGLRRGGGGLRSWASLAEVGGSGWQAYDLTSLTEVARTGGGVSSYVGVYLHLTPSKYLLKTSSHILRSMCVVLQTHLPTSAG